MTIKSICMLSQIFFLIYLNVFYWRKLIFIFILTVKCAWISIKVLYIFVNEFKLQRRETTDKKKINYSSDSDFIHLRMDDIDWIKYIKRCYTLSLARNTYYSFFRRNWVIVLYLHCRLCHVYCTANIFLVLEDVT